MSGKKPQQGILIVNIEDRDLFAVVVVMLAALMVGLATFAIMQHRTNVRITRNADEIARQAKVDLVRSRHADARQCARENLVRAEVHVAYQLQQPMPPPEAFAAEPILRVLLDSARRVQEHGLKRVRRNLPILECAPNLTGAAAYPLADKKQGRFVELYRKGRLDPTPGWHAANTGPDE